MTDWKSGKLLKNCDQIATAVLECFSVAIPLHGKKHVPTASSLSRDNSEYNRRNVTGRKGNYAEVEKDMPKCGGL